MNTNYMKQPTKLLSTRKASAELWPSLLHGTHKEEWRESKVEQEKSSSDKRPTKRNCEIQLFKGVQPKGTLGESFVTDKRLTKAARGYAVMHVH